MKNICSAIIPSLLLIGGNIFSQSFTFTQIDFYKAGNPGDELICTAQIINSTSNAISMRVTRQLDVMPDAPAWTSAFCMDVCYFPTVDGVDYTFDPMDTVNFTFHFNTASNTPDHALAKMRWKNVNNPSNTFNADFFGSTDGSLGLHDLSANTANVAMYPQPVASGEVFTMNVSNIKTANTISMVIYNMFGSVVSTKKVIAGINLMNIDLPAGVYSYNMISGNTTLNSGKLAISK